MAPWVPGQPNVTMKRIPDDAFPSKPGEFHWKRAEDGSILACVLADNRGRVHVIPVRKGFGGATWKWDGNEDQPTLSPSILSWSNDSKGNRHIHWHGFVRGGVVGFEC